MHSDTSTNFVTLTSMNPRLGVTPIVLRSNLAPSKQIVSGLLVLLLATAGCRDSKVADYRISKENDAEIPMANTANTAVPSPAMPAPGATAPAPAMPSSPALATATGAVLTWTAPATWQPKALGQMRKGSFTLAGPDAATTADLSITAFPGAVGGELANVNRWRGQLSLAPITDAELPANVTRAVVAGGLAFTIVDIAGSGDQPQRIIGAMVPFDQAMWFFKLSGPDAFVASQKPAFLSFLQTVKATAPSNP
jgi:hypothetical protein